MRLKGKNLWEVGPCRQASWMWNNLLELRGTVRNHIWVKLGNGMNTSMWYDKWCSEGPLCNFITNRDVYSAHFIGNFNLCDIIVNGCWKCPDE